MSDATRAALDAYNAACEGSGAPLNTDMAIIFGVGRCPVCNGLVTADDEAGTLDAHTVKVIDV